MHLECLPTQIYDGLAIVMGISKERAVLFSGAILTAALVYLVATRVGTVVLSSIGFEPVFISG